MNEAVSRRSFIGLVSVATAAVGLTNVPFLGFLENRYSVRVFKFEAISGVRYSRADKGHIANKIYPDVASAVSRRPHRGFKAELKETVVYTKQPVSITELFAGRRDIDFRSKPDIKHFQQFAAGNGSKNKQRASEEA
ncbi:MAG TPA: twin-arginine translocation signal domain-containing protein [Kiritimatiellia bacterium]|nr:twin-arginine translocation signal domain-containing protein [Kiritimatiellia bacterium]